MVKVLKSETYQCHVCKYTWQVVEPEICQPEPTPATIPENADGEKPVNGQVPPPLYVRPLFDPSGADVPKPPGGN
jgi:hypothetical protein